MTCSECFHYKACCDMAGTSVLVEVDFGGHCDHYIHTDDVIVKREVMRDASHDIEVEEVNR